MSHGVGIGNYPFDIVCGIYLVYRVRAFLRQLRESFDMKRKALTVRNVPVQNAQLYFSIVNAIARGNLSLRTLTQDMASIVRNIFVTG